MFGYRTATIAGIWIAFTLATVPQVLARGSSWTFADLYEFTGPPDGYSPLAPLIEDASGNLYGTAFEGGTTGGVCDSTGCGTVFELSPVGHGTYTEQILHAFAGTTKDGCTPVGGVVLDLSGNLYGTLAGCGVNGLGQVYELSPGGSGWTETILWNFVGAPNDGAVSYSTPVVDMKGRLFGTTLAGGSGNCSNTGFPHGCGVVFEVVSARDGGWKESIVYSFTGGSSDGNAPKAGVTLGSDGTLYGLTSFGGPYSQGVLYALKSTGGRKWAEAVLHTFPENEGDGTYPVGVPIIDDHGRLFGASSLGGKMEGGTIWEVSPDGNSWSEKVLFSFTTSGNAPNDPYAGVIFGPKDILYGTTVEGAGGCDGFGCGAVYSFNLKTGKLHTLLAFDSTDTNSPESALLRDAQGNLFGTTAFGGDNTGSGCQGILTGCGTVYELSR